VQAMGLSGISKSTASKLCKDIDERVREVLDGRSPATGPISGSTRPTSRCVRAGGSSPSPP
jgi:hypothetical protein